MTCVLAERAAIERQRGNEHFAAHLDLWSGIIHDSDFPLQWAFDQSAIEVNGLWPLLEALAAEPYSTKDHEKIILFSPEYGWRFLSHAPEKRARSSAPIRPNSLPDHCSIRGGKDYRPPSFADVFEWGEWKGGLTQSEMEQRDAEAKQRYDREVKRQRFERDQAYRSDVVRPLFTAHTESDKRKILDHIQTGQPYIDTFGITPIAADEDKGEPEAVELPASLADHAKDSRIVECVRLLRAAGKDDAHIARRIGRALKHKMGQAEGLVQLRSRLIAQSPDEEA